MSGDKPTLGDLDPDKVSAIWSVFGGKETTITDVIDNPKLNKEIGSRATVGATVRLLADLDLIGAPDRCKPNDHAKGGKLRTLKFPAAAPKLPEKAKEEPKPKKEKAPKDPAKKLQKLAAKTNPKPVPIPPK